MDGLPESVPGTDPDRCTVTAIGRGLRRAVGAVRTGRAGHPRAPTGRYRRKVTGM